MLLILPSMTSPAASAIMMSEGTYWTELAGPYLTDSEAMSDLRNFYYEIKEALKDKK